LSGMDYMKLLADTGIRASEAVSETELESGSVSASESAWDGEGTITAVYRGPAHWGERITFDSQASSGVDAVEVYAEADAMAIGTEANDIGDWFAHNSTFVSVADAGAGSTWAGRMQREAAPGEAYVHEDDVGSLEIGVQYQISFWYRRVTDTSTVAKLVFYQTLGGLLTTLHSVDLSATSWTQVTFKTTALKSGALEIRLVSQSGAEFDEIRIDNITVREYDPVWYRYTLPPWCNGPYFVTLDGEPVWQGQRDANGHFDGWIYDGANQYFLFDEDRYVEAGVNNLQVYYYTTQRVEWVLADLLSHSGLYESRAAALADMDYTPTV